MNTSGTKENLVIYPSGRIDANNATDFLNEVNEILEKNDSNTLEINMKDVEYVSSAGLRTFMKLEKDGVSLRLTELSPSVYDIFEVTGFTQLFNIKKALRTMSVDGCEVIGSGFTGTIYRVDEETIVKVYNEPDSIPMIENEKRKAQQAFLNGIPTAISYDIVKVGDKYGAVFELLRAKTLNDILIEEPERIDELLDRFVGFVKMVHETEVTHGPLPSAVDKYLGYLGLIREHLTADQYDILKEYFERIPEDHHVIHGDFHLKNTMLVDGELMLIDMDTLSAGQPIFDLAGMYVTYMMFKEDEPGNSMRFLGISDEMSEKIWNGIFDRYFCNLTESEKDALSNRIRIMAALRFLHIIIEAGTVNSELGQLRLKHSLEHISELLEKVDGLYIEL